MGLLLAKILLLLGVAALCGAWFTYWWFRRNYEDITLEYLRSREEWASWRQSFEERLVAGGAADLQPLTQQLTALAAAVRAIHIPEPAPSDLAPLEARLDEIERRIGAIRVPEAVAPDLSPLMRSLAALETSVSGLSTPAAKELDVTAAMERLASLDSAVRAIRIPEPAPALNLAPLEARLGALEGAVRSMPLPLSPSVDLTSVLEAIGRLQARLESPPASQVAIREGSRNLLTRPVHGKPDDLTQIKGVAKVLERKLHNVGVFYFWQIAEWSREDVAHVDSQLEAFQGRIDRDDWVTQATELAASPQAAHRPVEH
jgi:predicted flap endonuclease-1-like 5' DNA nuclease